MCISVCMCLLIAYFNFFLHGIDILLYLTSTCIHVYYIITLLLICMTVRAISCSFNVHMMAICNDFLVMIIKSQSDYRLKFIYSECTCVYSTCYGLGYGETTNCMHMGAHTPLTTITKYKLVTGKDRQHYLYSA